MQPVALAHFLLFLFSWGGCQSGLFPIHRVAAKTFVSAQGRGGNGWAGREEKELKLALSAELVSVSMPGEEITVVCRDYCYSSRW